MNSFLLQVAENILAENNDLANHILVLPNQRAGIYLKKAFKDIGAKTMFLPEIVTFDRFAETLSGIPKIPAIELLFDFYTIYKRITPSNQIESFESFSQWAPSLLDDMNQIDAYLIQPKDILGTLKDINQLQNWSPDTELTQNYLAFFQKLESYYYELRKELLEHKKAYQGLIFREAVKNVHLFIENTRKHIIFIGFNHLNTSETQIVQELLEAGRANIYFDISKELLESHAGIFIRKYLNTWNYFKTHQPHWIQHTNIQPEIIEIIGASKNVDMFKYAGELLEKNKNTEKTAIVLANQNLLPIAMNSLPKTVQSVNITMGMPLKQAPFSDLVLAVFELFTHHHSQKKEGYYYKKIFKIIQHPIIQNNLTNSYLIYQKLVKQNKAFISYQEIINTCDSAVDIALLDILFKPLEQQNLHGFLSKLHHLIDTLKDTVRDFEREILYQHFQLIHQLEHLISKYNYIHSIKSLYQIYKQLLFSEKINFIGEPLQGLQVMGFLETQAIDFEELIITSLNEGILPGNKQSNSFIPFDVRKHYGLPTYQENDAISQYHFLRLLQRAKKVSLLYTVQTDSFGGGEKSRFLTQLTWKYPHIVQQLIHTQVPVGIQEPKSITKTSEVMEKLDLLAQKGVSASALGLYLYSPIHFYYEKILGVKAFQELEETIESHTMGTVMHDTLEALYKPFIGKILEADSLRQSLKNIKSQVIIGFHKIYPNGQFEYGKNKLIFEVIVNFVRRFIESEIRAIKYGKQIKIIALEKKLSHKVKFPRLNRRMLFHGFVDRIDEINGVVRIVDYKSGMVQAGNLKLDTISKIKEDYKYAKALQVLLYAKMYMESPLYDKKKELQAGIVSFKNLKNGFIPVNFATGRKKDFSITPDIIQEFMVHLEDLLLEIFDTSIAFTEKESLQ